MSAGNIVHTGLRKEISRGVCLLLCACGGTHQLPDV
jgi:hypothetical protein